ncbi:MULTISPECIES: hypothetical protein [unclassified Mycobacterium]|uniref:hypothetical protein n=1 Tax=unclassified Mycobacterium TaxID=2642494 RepID=UPI0029C84A85|nr:MULTISPECIES: hypothetical protein [unclassified Mycobacterium]
MTRRLAAATIVVAVALAGAAAGEAMADPPHQNSYCRDQAYREAHPALCPPENSSPPPPRPGQGPGGGGGSGGVLGDLLDRLGLGGLGRLL